MELQECSSCSITFGLTREFIDFCKRNDHTFYCPNGHKLIFTESTTKKLEQKIKQLEWEIKLNKKDYSTLPLSGKCPFCGNMYSVLRHHYRVHSHKIDYSG